MFLKLDDPQRTHLYIDQYKHQLPHSTEFLFSHQNNSLPHQYEPTSADPFVSQYFLDAQSHRTIMVLNISEAYSVAEVKEFFEGLFPQEQEPVDFVGRCFLGSDHDRELDFLRGIDSMHHGLPLYSRGSQRLPVHFICFQSAELLQNRLLSQGNVLPVPVQMQRTEPSMDQYIEHAQNAYIPQHNLKNLQQDISRSLQTHDKEEKTYLDTIERIRNVPNKDGWVKVLPKLGHSSTRPPLTAAEIHARNEEKRSSRKSQAKELYDRKVPLYNFQMRHEKEKSLKLLKQQFQEARDKISMLKNHNLFQTSLDANVNM